MSDWALPDIDDQGWEAFNRDLLKAETDTRIRDLAQSARPQPAPPPLPVMGGLSDFGSWATGRIQDLGNLVGGGVQQAGAFAQDVGQGLQEGFQVAMAPSASPEVPPAPMPATLPPTGGLPPTIPSAAPDMGALSLPSPEVYPESVFAPFEARGMTAETLGRPLQRGLTRAGEEIAEGAGRIRENIPAANTAAQRFYAGDFGAIGDVAGALGQTAWGGLELATAPANIPSSIIEEASLQGGASAPVAAGLGLAAGVLTPGGLDPTDIVRLGRQGQQAVRRLDAGQEVAETLSQLPARFGRIGLTAGEEVERLRLDKFPAELRPLIQGAAEDVGFAVGQRRGVVGDVAAEAGAADLQRTTEQWLRGGRAGRAYNTEELRALAGAVARQAQRVSDITGDITTKQATGEVTDRQLAALLTEGETLKALTAVREGARAEAGRAMRAFQAETRVLDGPAEGISRIFATVGGRENALTVASEYQTMLEQGADPTQIARFWARVEKPPVSAGDWFRTLRYNAMLSGPRTAEVNAIGSVGEIAWRMLRDAPGDIANVARGRPQELIGSWAGLEAGLQRGSRAFWETISKSITEEQALRGEIPRDITSRLDPTQARRFPGLVRAAQPVAAALETTSRYLSGTDELFRQAAYGLVTGRRAGEMAAKEGLQGQAWTARMVELLDSPTEAMSKEAVDAADRMTFRNEMGPFGRRLQGIQELTALGVPVGHLALPFLRTVANITARGIDRSPLGLIGTGIDVARGAYRGGRVPQGAAPLGERLADNAMGSLAFAWFQNQALQGNISGAGPDDPRTRDVLRAEGWQPYSIRVGDEWWSYANWGPVAVPLSLAAGVGEAWNYRKPGANFAQMSGDAAINFAGILAQQPYLQGLGAIYNGINDPDRYGGQWVSNVVTSLVPFGGAVATAAQALDPYERQTARASEVGLPGAVTQAVQARLPVAREQLPVARDVFGREREGVYSGAAAVSPIRATEPSGPEIRRYRGSPSAEEDRRIAQAIRQVDLYEGNRREYPKPNQEAVLLARRFKGRENPQYQRQIQIEQQRQRREAAARAGATLR